MSRGCGRPTDTSPRLRRTWTRVLPRPALQQYAVGMSRGIVIAVMVLAAFNVSVAYFERRALRAMYRELCEAGVPRALAAPLALVLALG